jgi:hypothetical protein
MRKSFWRRRQPEIRSHVLEYTDVPSADPDLFFHMDAEVQWEQLPSSDVHRNPLSVIRTYIQKQADPIACREPVTRAAVVQDAINAKFGLPIELTQSGMLIRWAEARLTVDPISISTAMRRTQHKREMRLEAERQEHEIQRIEAFRKRVLSKPDMALTYHFLESQGSANKEAYERLETLSLAIARYDQNTYWIQVSEIVLDFVRDLKPSERQDTLKALVFLFQRYGRPEFASRLDSLQPESL